MLEVLSKEARNSKIQVAVTAATNWGRSIAAPQQCHATTRVTKRKHAAT